MKSVRPLLISLGAAVALLGFVVALALKPSVQGWALRRIVAQTQPGLRLDFTRVAAGPNRVELHGLKLDRSGLRVEATRFSADYSLWRYLTGGTLHLTDLAAEGLVVDVSSLSTGQAGAGAAGAPAAAPGAVAQLQLPFALIVDRLSLAGRVLLPGSAPAPALPAEFSLTGGGIAPGQDGTLRFSLALADTTPQARVTALRAEGDLTVRQTATHGFDRARLTVVVEADGPAISQQHQLKLAASLDTVGGAADYALTLDTVQDGATENLVRVQARQTAPDAAFAGEWSVQARTAQVEAFLLGGDLPRFAVQGAGRFEVQPATAAVAVSGTWSGEVAALELLDPRLRPLGALRFESEFDVADASGVTRVEKLSVQLDGVQPVLSVVTRRSIVVDRRTRQLQLGGPAVGEIGRLTIHRLPLAWVRPFVSALDVSGGTVSGDFVLTNGSEELRLRSAAPLQLDALTLVHDGRLLVERAEFTTLLHLALAPGQARAEVRDLEFRTPAGDRVLGGFSVQLPLAQPGETQVRGNLVADLPALLETLAGVGHLKFAGELDAAVTEEQVAVRSFRGELADGAGRKLLEAAGTEPFSFDLARGQLVSRGADELVLARIATGRIVFGDLPWPGLSDLLRGAAEPAAFTLSARGPRILLRSGAPVRVSGFGLRDGGQALLDGLDLELTPAADFATVVDWKLAAPGTQVRDASGATLATLGLEASASPADGLRAAAGFGADLVALAAQPALASWRALAAGRASGEVRAARTAAGWQAEARATLNGLVAREGNLPLPVANLSARALRGRDGRLTIEAPLLLDRSGRRSDLRLAAEATRRDGVIHFDATLTGQHIELLDVLGLAALLPGGVGNTAQTLSAAEQTAVARTGVRIVADAQPFWQGLQGAVALDVQSLSRGEEWKVSGLTGRAVVEAGQVALQKFEGRINERGRVAADARMNFTGGTRPYALEGSFTLTEFDLGVLLKALEPDRPPTVEGVFGVTGKFTGFGATPADTFGRTRGQFQLTSRQGVFRGLRRASEKVSVASRAVELGAAIGSIFGSSRVKEAAEKVAGQAYQVDQLAQALAELPFDQLVVQLNRDERLNVQLEQFALLSPEVRLTGRGTITHVEGRPILQQPLSLTFALAARGKLEQQLARLRALDGTKDDLGYAKMRESGTLGGTLSRPDPSAFFLKLAESKLGEFLGSGGN